MLGWVCFSLSILIPEASHPPKGPLRVNSALIIDCLGQRTDNDGMRGECCSFGAGEV